MTHTYNDRVAAEVRAELGRQRKSGSWLARALDATRPAMTRRLAGEVHWTVDELQRIADVLGVPMQQFTDLGKGPESHTDAAQASA